MARSSVVWLIPAIRAHFDALELRLRCHNVIAVCVPMEMPIFIDGLIIGLHYAQKI